MKKHCKKEIQLKTKNLLAVNLKKKTRNLDENR